jgi:hypothetical protein
MPGLLSGSDCYRGCRSDHHASWGGEWRGGGADGTGERDHGVSAQSRRVRGPLRVASGSVPGARDLFTPGLRPWLRDDHDSDGGHRPDARSLRLLVRFDRACANPSSTAGQSDVAVTLPACSWPTGFDSPEAAVGQCIAARVYLSCRGSNGGGMECLSDTLTECPGPNPTPGVSYSDCDDQCQPGEYALACGGPGPGPWPQPPTTCHVLPSGPGGGSISCCPCGS